MAKYVLSVLVENRFGVLARVATLIAGRGFNIDSLAVGETEDPTASRMTIVFDGDERTSQQIKKQLNRIVDVISVQDLTQEEYLDRELILCKVNVAPKARQQVIEVAETLKAEIEDVGPKTVTIQMVGDQTKVGTLLELVKPFGIKEIVRTGRIATAREKRKES